MDFCNLIITARGLQDVTIEKFEFEQNKLSLKVFARQVRTSYCCHCEAVARFLKASSKILWSLDQFRMQKMKPLMTLEKLKEISERGGLPRPSLLKISLNQKVLRRSVFLIN